MRTPARLFSRLSLLWAILLVASVQAGMPVAAYARMAAQASLTQEICSPLGARKVVIDADGAVREVAPDASHDDHCPLCTAASTATGNGFDGDFTAPGRTIAAQSAQTGGFAPPRLSPPATGPPAGL